ncbi:unnamed protein product [Camellia sinensis]
MAPKKRSDEGEGEEKKPVIVKRELMVTRSSTRRLNGNSSTDSLSSPKPKYKPRTKKAKTSAKEDLKEQKVQVQTAEVKAVADDSSKTIVIEHWGCPFLSGDGLHLTQSGPFLAVLASRVGLVVGSPCVHMFCVDYRGLGLNDEPRTLWSNVNKQCNSFKTRAIQVKNGLESGLSGVNVLVNPEKPRRGCFEIREEGGEKFISLLDMKRPFTPMKALDMDKVISDIIDKIK